MVKDDSLLQNQIRRVPEYGLRRFFETLASDFQRVSGALDYMRKVYLRPAARNSPYRDLLDQSDRIC
jgi:hypothetical protein